MKSGKQRIAWIDNVKFFAILCVILGHSFSLIQGNFKGYDEINLFIVAFNMPLFSMISGITSYKSISQLYGLKNLIKYLNKISWRIGVPTVIYTLIAMTIGYGMQMRLMRCFISGGILIIVVFSVYAIYNLQPTKFKWIKICFPYTIIPICFINQSVWYFVYLLMTLFAASISSFLSHEKSNWSPSVQFVIFSLSFLLLSLLIAPFSPFFSLAELYLPFIVGYSYSKLYGMNKFFHDSTALFLAVIILFFIGIATFFFYYSIPNQFYLLDLFHAYRNGVFDIFIYRQLSAVTLSMAIILIIQMLSSNYNKIAIVGAMTFGIYTIYSELIGIIKNIFGTFNSNTVFVDVMLVVTVSVLLLSVSVFCVKLIRKNNYLKLILLGE